MHEIDTNAFTFSVNKIIDSVINMQALSYNKRKREKKNKADLATLRPSLKGTIWFGKNEGLQVALNCARKQTASVVFLIGIFVSW